MIAALYHGAKPPAWYGFLVAAAEWGVPPWEIEEKIIYGGQAYWKWYFRWITLRGMQAEKAENEAKR